MDKETDSSGQGNIADISWRKNSKNAKSAQKPPNRRLEQNNIFPFPIEPSNLKVLIEKKVELLPKISHLPDRSGFLP
ncbi:hypothetical protein [Leptolyngbya ohadii]|uniref:hypothetical protein n=1 Tax=Leptolyngbya ohadii TaxID=1962290 RepID=UPI0015C68923|nr:hypothetical protein [Leptolyngbya ohadii]